MGRIMGRVISEREHKARSRHGLTVGDVMTAQPLTIGRDQTLETAHVMMRENGIRHLPVLEHGALVGIVTQRDLYFLETIAGVDLTVDVVDDAMSPETYAVGPDTPIDEVAAEMAQHKYGCAVVMERGRVAGIFTATDAVRLLASTYRSRAGGRGKS